MTHYCELSDFDDFLSIARQQGPAEHLLLVIARRELPKDHTEEQARRFATGEGGHLAPLATVDRPAHDLRDFAQFADDATEAAGEWDAVFVAALPGTGDRAPTPELIFEAGESMVTAIRDGRIGNYLVFDVEGTALQLMPA